MLERFDLGDFVIGHEIAEGLVQPNVSRDSICHILIIARNHHHAGHADVAQPRYDGFRGFARRVHQTDYAQIALTMAHNHRCAAIGRQRIDALCQVLGHWLAVHLIKQGRFADMHNLAIIHGGNTATGYACKIGCAVGD